MPQHTLKGFVLFDEIPRLFIALTGVAFQILPPSTALLSSFRSSFSSSSSSDGHGSRHVGLGKVSFLSFTVQYPLDIKGTRTAVHVALLFHGSVHKVTVVILHTPFG